MLFFFSKNIRGKACKNINKFKHVRASAPIYIMSLAKCVHRTDENASKIEERNAIA